MATNQYFSHGTNSEQNLLEDLTIELIKQKGYDLWYLPREFVNKDNLFGEDVLNKFSSSYEIEMYLSSVDGFEGEGDFMSKFGLQIRDSAKLVVAKKRFDTEVTQQDSKVKRPREGDLIYFPLSQGLFEITWVEHENPFYQLGKNYSYTLTVELFEYSNEELNTGVSDVDVLVGSELLNSDSVSNDPYADNTDIETEADNDVIDFSEDNPFGSF